MSSHRVTNNWRHKIDTYAGSFVVKCALRISPLVFIRPRELRQAGWDEIDLDNALWTIPATRKPTEASANQTS
jgi:integrase